MGTSLARGNELKYLYESHEEFAVLPTFFILPALQAAMSSSAVSSAIPGKEVDLTQILHGEQYIEVSFYIIDKLAEIFTCSYFIIYPLTILQL